MMLARLAWTTLESASGYERHYAAERKENLNVLKSVSNVWVEEARQVFH